MDKRYTIYVYGFDRIGFDIKKPVEKSLRQFNIHFILFKDDQPFDSADGVIIPQGIFEDLKPYSTYLGISYNVRVYKDLLLYREREISNLIKSGKCVCFIVEKIVDSVTTGQFGMETQDIHNTDLCKKVLNTLKIQRNAIEGNPNLHCKVNEFSRFIEKYGVAKTEFEIPKDNSEEFKILIESNSKTSGFEFQKKLFFIPAHFVNKTNVALFKMAEELADAIFSYIAKRQLDTPHWLSEMKFSNESILLDKLNKLRKEEIDIEKELNRFQKYKAILTTSGDILNELISEILQEYFLISIDPSDNKKEDIKVLNEEGDVIAFIEVKGTKKSVKREYINQVDSHRERAGVTNKTPGILIINNEMSIEGIENKKGALIAKEQIIHATKMNVLIIRTIDLLNLMLLWEEVQDRRSQFLSIVLNNSGWLKVESSKYDIIKK